jgi:hypothetical protein
LENTEQSDGKVLNIYSWNDEFRLLMENFYDGYEKVDSDTGKIGDVQVNWKISSNYDSYYDFLVDAIDKQDDADQDDKVDIFLAEGDSFYLGDYYAVPVTELGIKEDELSDQYNYTKQLMRGSGSKIYGLTWQVAAGGLIYNRRIAKDMWGTDDPETVQEYVKNWNAFYDTAADLAEHGYRITATVEDTCLVYSTKASIKWVEDDNLNIPSQMESWTIKSRILYEEGAAASDYIWSDTWYDGLNPDSNVFAYFGPMWLINDYFDIDGGYGIVAAPDSFSWGGSWICAASGTDNKELIADIMRELTIDEDNMREIARSGNEFVNNKSVMEDIANDSSYGIPALDGQNPFGILMECAENINVNNKNAYDVFCNNYYTSYMIDYIGGGYSSYAAALSAFRSYVTGELGLAAD